MLETEATRHNEENQLSTGVDDLRMSLCLENGFQPDNGFGNGHRDQAG